MHLTFLFAAFAVVWVGLLLYVTSLSRRNRELRRDLDDLRTELRRKLGPGSSP